MTEFIPGLELNRRFYQQVVSPILDEQFPGLRYAAARIGYGSDVLGFDTPMSTDHDWGVRFTLFVPQVDDAIAETLRHTLPYTFMGYSVNFSPPDPNDNGTQSLAAIDSGPVNHRIEVMTLESFTQSYLGIDPAEDLTSAHWLTIPGQILRGTTAGAVYHDGVGDLTRLRERLAYYPQDVWLYLMAAEWQRIGQEEHFLGRTGDVGDDLGSRLIAARLVQDMMRLCFLQERVYAPYSKWFGTAFLQLQAAETLQPMFAAVLSAPDWQAREAALIPAVEWIAQRHNALKLTPPMRETAVSFFGRPFKVMFAGELADALLDQITDPAMKQIADQTRIGSVEQFSTSSDFLESVSVRKRVRGLYRAE